MDKLVSIIIPFASNEGQDIKLPNHPITTSCNIIYNTIQIINNINKVLTFNKEIIIVDNTHSFPDIVMPNLRIVKGWQALDREQIINQPSFEKYNIDDFNNLSMWVSMAYNVGIQHAKGDYIICQHNDVFYHSNLISRMIKDMEINNLEYISADYKKIFLSGYVANKEVLYKHIPSIEFSPEDGGYVKTKAIGFADCYFFLSKKSFYDDYFVDWGYGDTNHGATIKCLDQGKQFLHLGPYYDNPNFKTENSDHDYLYKDSLFITHLKGGFSEDKYAEDKYNENKINRKDIHNFQTRLEKLC